MLAQDQYNDAGVIADIKIQGKTKTLDLGIFWEYAVLKEELFFLVGMMDGPFLQPLHSFTKFLAPGRRPNQYDWGYLAAIGDRAGRADPPYVKVKKSYFGWRQSKPVKEVDDDSKIANSTTLSPTD